MKVTRTRDVKLPSRGTSASAGLDFFIPNDFQEKTLHPGEHAMIPSGIKVNVPEGHALIAFNKSGVSTKQRLQVGACVVDEDYQGEIHLHVHNLGPATVLKPGQKLVQFILIPVTYAGVKEVEEGDLYEAETERGDGGFGSTGTGTGVSFSVGQLIDLRLPYELFASTYEVIEAFSTLEGSKEEIIKNISKLKRVKQTKHR